MRILVCLPFLALIAATPPAGRNRACPAAKATPADGQKPLQAHPLSQEPGAHQEVAVLRTDQNGCVRPVVVRENVGGKSPPVRKYPASPAMRVGGHDQS